jgi:stage II sporulation protein D
VFIKLIEIHKLFALIFYLLVLCSCTSKKAETSTVDRNPDDVDVVLQRVAIEALGDKEGTVIVMDPQNGRLRAVANERIAFEQAFPPGSTIKPFTALAAMRAGLLDAELRTLCQEKYTNNGYEIICSHPKSQSSFTPVQALAHSCNYYFAKIGQRLNSGAFYSTLDSFGFGSRTGINVGGEVNGRLIRDQWHVSDALGDSEHVLVTPIQLLTAYTALFNGGHLFRPQRLHVSEFTPQESKQINILPNHRLLLIEGMRGAVKYGTASRAQLDSLPFYTFGKTGTSRASNGFRTQGWFVGFLSTSRSVEDTVPHNLKLAVLVFLKRSHGSEGAELAKTIFETYSNNQDKRESTSQRIAEASSPIPHDPVISDSDTNFIKVHLVAEDITKTVSLDDYMLGVLSAEASIEKEMEALKAQAVISRTFALRNLGRHKEQGYDFCSTTHCQRYVLVGDKMGRKQVSQLIRQAVGATRGEVLKDLQGQVIDAYFHAACGGKTANIETLWGTSGLVYLRGVKDDYCTTMPHRYWQQLISKSNLVKALNSDPRSTIGSRLDDIVIRKQDESGRAEWIALEGEKRQVIRGWDFKIIIGRALGWNILKSSRFEVMRSGPNFIFRGGGFGHGLGVCQEGSHVMAKRGMSYQQILEHYLPSTKLDKRKESVRETAKVERNYVTYINTAGNTPHVSTTSDLSLSSENFQISYPFKTEKREVQEVISLLENARRDMIRRTGSVPGKLKVVIHETTQDFTASTEQMWWVAGATRANRIELQPLRVLRRRKILMETLRHEYTHAVIEWLGGRNVPRWLAEGLAIHFAGEAKFYSKIESKVKLSQEDIEKGLNKKTSAEETKALYAAAYREVKQLINKQGEEALWKHVVQYGKGG